MTSFRGYGRSVSPCKECHEHQGQYEGCHDKCEEYLEYRRIHDEEVLTIKKRKYEANITYRKRKASEFTPSGSDQNKVFKNHKR